MASEFSTGKSVFILAIVAGCFAILWPNIFYPMLQGTYQTKPGISTTQGVCCDVIFDNDVEAIKVMSDLCDRILRNITRPDNNKMRKINLNPIKMDAIVEEACRDTIWLKCHPNISLTINSQATFNMSYKQFIKELRTFNSTDCLKHIFGVSLRPFGLPKIVRTWGVNRPKHIRQERPPHLRPEFLHPALREKGRAIPHSHIVPNIEGRSTPLPVMRPPMGGAGHVVPPPKGSSTMGIVMPMYTIGIVVFFLYTMMKLMLKKSDSNGYDGSGFTTDPNFHRAVFGDYGCLGNEEVVDDATKLVVTAITGLVEEVNKQIRSDENLSSNQEAENDQLKKIESHSESNKDECDNDKEEEVNMLQESSGIVKVLGYEMTESSATGGKYSKPSTPTSRPSTPQNLYLPNPLPPQSQLIVSKEQTRTVPSEDTNQSVILSARVTLSLIGLPNKENVESDENDPEKSIMNISEHSPEDEVPNVIDEKTDSDSTDQEDVFKMPSDVITENEVCDPEEINNSTELLHSSHETVQINSTKI